MKNVLLIGLGRFGRHLAMQLSELGHQVMAVDRDEERVNECMDFVTNAQIGDSTRVDFLRSLGVGNYDVCYVTISGDFQNSLETTSLLKELGAKYVVSRAERDVQAKFLLRNGADEVIYPEKDIAERCAARFSMDNVFDYIEISSKYGIYEISPLKEWVGKSIRESNIAARYRVTIIGIKKEGRESHIMPSADDFIEDGEHLIVLASHETARKLLKQL